MMDTTSSEVEALAALILAAMPDPPRSLSIIGMWKSIGQPPNKTFGIAIYRLVAQRKIKRCSVGGQSLFHRL